MFYNSSPIRLGTKQRFGDSPGILLCQKRWLGELIQFLSFYFSRVAKILGNIASGRLKCYLVSLNRRVPYNSGNSTRPATVQDKDALPGRPTGNESHDQWIVREAVARDSVTASGVTETAETVAIW